MFVKIKLSTYWWNNFYFSLGLGLLAEVMIIFFEMNYVSPDEEYRLLLWAMPFVAAAFLDVAFHPWRFLMTMEINDGVIRSFLFGKLKCEVFTDKEIFYAVFDCRESSFATKKYIAISNEKFVYEERQPSLFSENRFIDYYDRTKQIILPYNENTKHLFRVNHWICVS